MARLNKAGLAAEILGLGPGGGGLQKLQITHDGYGGQKPIVALFNPHELAYSRSVDWQARTIAVQGQGASWTDAIMRRLSS